MTYKKLFFFALISTFLLNSRAFSQLVVSPNQTAAVLARTLAGTGAAIFTPTLTCPGVANGTFTVTGTPLAMTGGIVLTNGHSAACAGPEGPLVSFNNAAPGDPAITALLPGGVNSYDACILQFDVVPTSDTISFNYQFGSEEYRNAVCSIYTDLFGFFISGPGITGTVNMALVPGTTIPVEINSVNNGGLGTVGGAAHINCTSLGAGSPFTAYYLDNTGGSRLTYRGYTTKFRAFHTVTPCDTYHIKLSIADAGDALYDSGVFLEGGSLRSNSYSFDRLDSIGITVGGVPHTIVKGCDPAVIKIRASSTSSSPQTIHLTFGGTAINGIDVSTVPASLIMSADSSTVSFSVNAIPTPPGGAKTFTIYISSGCGMADSISLNILDTPSVSILTADTSVCSGTPFQIIVSGTPGLSYSWSPATGLSSSTVMDPIVSPSVATNYTMTATFPGLGCPVITRLISVGVSSLGVSLLSGDTTICVGKSITLDVAGSLSYTYVWWPSLGLSNPVIQNPVATPSVSTIYSVTVSNGSCTVLKQVSVIVFAPDPVILTPDTSVCAGASFSIRIDGDPLLNYNWSPAAGLSNSGVMEPVATPSVNTTYIVSASETTPGGAVCSAVREVSVTMFPPLLVNAGPDQNICVAAPIRLSAAPVGPEYSYIWSGPNGFSSTLQSPDVYNLQPGVPAIYSVTVLDNGTGCSGSDTTIISVLLHTVSLTNVTLNQVIPYGSSVQLNADSALFFLWTPDNGTLDNPNINNPVATPLSPTTYKVVGMDIHGCRDSAAVTIDVTYGNIFIPDAFTPNGDGLNDFFKVGNLGYFKLAEMMVFNRWGEMVYHEVSGENKGWDGTFNGVPQGLGVFNYLVIVNDPAGAPHSFKGDITLIR